MREVWNPLPPSSSTKKWEGVETLHYSVEKCHSWYMDFAEFSTETDTEVLLNLIEYVKNDCYANAAKVLQ